MMSQKRALPLLAFVVTCLLSALSFAGDYGNSTGQQNIVSVNAGAASNGYWTQQPYSYCRCGRWYTSYKNVWVPGVEAKASAAATPIGSINTDNSSTHTYTYNITYGQLPAAQGSTLYGQPAYSEVADIYGNVDFGVLFDQAIRATNDAGNIYSKAQSGALELIDKASDRQTRVAETLAKGQADAQRFSALAELAKANAVPASVHVQRSTQYGSGQTQVGNSTTTTTTTTGGGDTGKLQVVFNQNCVKCHGGVKKEGGLDLRDVTQLDAEQGEKILDRITTTDLKKRMPRNEDGTAATLARDDFKVIFKYAQ